MNAQREQVLQQLNTAFKVYTELKSNLTEGIQVIFIDFIFLILFIPSFSFTLNFKIFSKHLRENVRILSLQEQQKNKN